MTPTTHSCASGNNQDDSRFAVRACVKPGVGCQRGEADAQRVTELRSHDTGKRGAASSTYSGVR